MKRYKSLRISEKEWVRKMRIAVAGAGYVGLANAVLLGQKNSVILVDPNEEKVALINQGKSPIEDGEIKEYLKKPGLNLEATTSNETGYKNAEVVLIAVPTDGAMQQGGLDTTIVERVVETVREISPQAIIVIKSTVPIGFTKGLSEKKGYENLFFSPEFLREGKALYDCLYPSRIIVGVVEKDEDSIKKAEMLSGLFLEEAKGDNIPLLIMGSTEAEAVKLFANSYLAMRIGFFNELDSFAELHNLESREIIEGMGADPRIGLHYNNPSFGYGGYCLPKDSKELKRAFADTPQELIEAIVEANATRKKHIASRIASLNPKRVGVYRLTMKKGSDNFREASIVDIMNELSGKGIEVVVYEPLLEEKNSSGLTLIDDLEEFASTCDVILANRMSKELEEYKEKVYTRDIFGEN